MSTIYLVDGSGYIFRAYYAIRPMRNAAGIPINAVFGFTKMLLRLIKEHQPKSMAVVFDAGRKTFRNDLYAEYKANRSEPPEDLRPQFDLCRDAALALGLPMIRQEGVEADDVLGTLARRAVAQDHNVVIVTGDKDMMQLVDERVTLLRFNSRTDAEEKVDIAGVKERFGVTPAQVVDVLALMGDSSDNIPGVDGIGEKTAMELIATHGSVEGVLAAAPSMKAGKRRDTLLSQADRARLSYKLATIITDTPLTVDPGNLDFHGIKVAESRAFFQHMGFKSLLADPMFAQQQPSLLDLPGASTPPPPSTPQLPLIPAPAVSETHYRTIMDVQALRDVVGLCQQAKRFSLETLTTNLDGMRADLVGLAMSWAPGEACYIPVGHDLVSAPGQMHRDLVREMLAPLLTHPNVGIVSHDAKYHLKVLSSHAWPEFSVAGDPMIASYILSAGESPHDLNTLAERELGLHLSTHEMLCGKGKSAITLERVPLDTASRHGGERADAVLRVSTVLEQRLQQQGLHGLYTDLELPLESVLMRMERAGVLVDAGVLRSLSAELRAECRTLETQAHQLAGLEFNLASPKQLQEVLFDKLGLPVSRKTKTGPSTDMDVLEELSVLHPLPAKVLEHRQLSKIIGTYLDALPALIHPSTGRIHTTYQQAVAATGRLSSQDPNLQNIPVRDEKGQRIRRAFIAPPGKVLLSADYNQIELRILAHLSEDKVLVGAFTSGEDVHARTASEIFGVPIHEVTKTQRRDAKTINFGLLYGMSAFGLSQALRIPRGQAKDYLNAYYARFSGVSAWQQKVLADARETGMVVTLFGRRRHLPGLREKNHTARQAAERMAINSPVQGTAADIIKRAMVDLDNQLTETKLPARMLLQVHDELILEVEQPAVEEVKALVKRVMESAADLHVKLAVDIGAGHSWGEAH